MADPRCLQTAVPWEPPGWRTPAGRSSSPPAALRPGGSPWRCATSCWFGGLWCGPGQNYTSGSFPTCLWCQSSEETFSTDWTLTHETHHCLWIAVLTCCRLLSSLVFCAGCNACSSPPPASYCRVLLSEPSSLSPCSSAATALAGTLQPHLDKGTSQALICSSCDRSATPFSHQV